MSNDWRSYDENGYLEVLVSYGYGAGWSTWDGSENIDLATDKRIVDFVKSDAFKNNDIQATREFFKTLGISIFDSDEDDEDDDKYEHIYGGGFFDCRIVKVKPGSLFRIKEYDGAESIEYFDENNWKKA